MTQAAYDSWVALQLEPDQRPMNYGGSPRMRGGFKLAPALAHQWTEQERQKWEEENNRREDEYLKKHNAG